MRLGDILQRLGRGETLSESEISYLGMMGNNIQGTNNIVSGWTKQSIHPSFEQMRSQQGEFSVIPVGALYLQGDVGNPPNTSTSGSKHYIYFYPTSSGSPQYFFYDEKKIYHKSASEQRAFLITGYVRFAANAYATTGDRKVGVDFFDESDVYLESYPFVEISASASPSSGYFTLPVSCVLRYESLYSNMSYMKIYAEQDSGDDMIINSHLSIFMLI